MKVSDLIELLSDCDPEAEVRLAHQPRYPLEFGVSEVSEVDVSKATRRRLKIEDELFQDFREKRLTPEEKEELKAEVAELELEPEEKVVYIAEGAQLGYLAASADEVWK